MYKKNELNLIYITNNKMEFWSIKKQRYDFLDEIPTEWIIEDKDELIKNATKRGYLFSIFYSGRIEIRNICLQCGGLVIHQQNKINCICPENIKLSSTRKTIKNLMYFVHEIYMQLAGLNSNFPDQWPRIVFENSKRDEYIRNVKFYKTLSLKTEFCSSAFTIYTKKCSLTKLAKTIEQIVMDLALNSSEMSC